MLYDLESHAKDGRCGLSRNEDIRRYVGKLIEKQTLDTFYKKMHFFKKIHMVGTSRLSFFKHFRLDFFQ